MKSTTLNLTKTKRNTIHFLTLIFILPVLAPGASLATERELWTDGHGDILIDYINGDWQWRVRVDDDPDDVAIVLGETAKLALPDDPGFSFLGDPGAPIWVIPQTSIDGVPFAGISSDTSAGTFQNDRIQMELASVTGPGDFAGWVAGTGSVEVRMNSGDGIDSHDRVSVPVPGHLHMNLGFTSPGTYEVGFRGSGTLTGESSPIVSDEQLYHFEVSVFKEGELDLEVAFENNEFEIAFLEEATETEHEAEEIALRVGPNTWQRVPASEAFSFLGASGDSLYVLPQNEREDVLFLGIAGDEIPAGSFMDETVNLHLSHLDGPGNLFLYGTDALGAPTVYLNSSDGIDDADVFPIGVGSHSHLNWAFSAPGIYRVGVTASGALASNGQEVSSETVELIFEVFAPIFPGQDEFDIEVVYEEDEWEIAILDEANELEYAPGEVVFSAGSESRQSIDPGLGLNAASLYIFPQTENPKLPFIGIAGDEIESGVFENEEVSLQLVSLAGPGDFFLYALDSFGNLVTGAPYFDSSNGIGDADVFPIEVGSHTHLNWGFSAPGIYRVGVQATGTKTDGDETLSSEVLELTFEIIARAVLDQGEFDIEVVYEEDEWEVAILDEANEVEYSPGEVVFLAGADSEQELGSELGFGVTSLYVFPQIENPGLPFIGIAVDEIESGVFENEEVSLQLVSLAGPGDLFFYALDSFGGLVNGAPFFDSSNGIDSADVFPMEVGSHSHLNWGFSSPGVYKVGVQASGTRLEDNETISGEVVELTFEILNEAFTVAISRKDSSTIQLAWPSKPGALYQIQSRADLIAGDWEDEGNPIPGDGEVILRGQPILPGEIMRVYRIRETQGTD